VQQKQNQNSQYKVFSEEGDKLLTQYYNEGDEWAITYVKFCKYNSTTPALSVLGTHICVLLNKRYMVLLCICNESPSRGASQSAVRHRWLNLCTVTVAFTMTKQADQPHEDNSPAHSTALVQAFWAKHHITQVCHPHYSPDLHPCDFRFFPKLKSPSKGRRFVNATVTQYTSSINGVSLPTD
jgi:hypothetical protein